MLAVAQFRCVGFGQYLYAGDDVSGAAWAERGWLAATDVRHGLFRLAAEAALELSSGIANADKDPVLGAPPLTCARYANGRFRVVRPGRPTKMRPRLRSSLNREKPSRCLESVASRYRTASVFVAAIWSSVGMGPPRRWW